MTRKRTIRETHDIHPNAPNALVTKLHKHNWNQRALARTLGVNSGHVTKLIRHGEEPSDATEQGRELRQRLCLPRYKKTNRPRREIKPKHMTYFQFITAVMRNETKRSIFQFRRRRK